MRERDGKNAAAPWKKTVSTYLAWLSMGLACLSMFCASLFTVAFGLPMGAGLLVGILGIVLLLLSLPLVLVIWLLGGEESRMSLITVGAAGAVNVVCIGGVFAWVYLDAE